MKNLFRIISHKIKDAIEYLISCVTNIFNSERNTSPKIQNCEIRCLPENRKVRLNSNYIDHVIKYVVGITEISCEETGIGILVNDINNISDKNTFMSNICDKFKYVTIYTENSESANSYGDLIYEKYGLPIMILNSKDFNGCAYPFTFNLDNGRFRYGRDIIIENVSINDRNEYVGLYRGNKLVS